MVELHLLTDDLTDVEPVYNPRLTPYREWPLSGLGKFEDILNALEKEISEADYFYFIDGDVRFQEDVLLADVSGDLVAVEHPMYPRNEWGKRDSRCYNSNPFFWIVHAHHHAYISTFWSRYHPVIYIYIMYIYYVEMQFCVSYFYLFY